VPPVLRGEFRKLTTVRGPWLLLAAEPLLVIAGISGLVVSAGNLRDPAVQSTALSHVGLAAMLTLVFGILAMAGEYRHRTITDTYLGFPSRGRVVAAKMAVTALVGAIASAVTTGVALATVALWWGAKDATFTLSTPDAWRTVVGGVAVNIAFGAIGVGIGALVHNVVVAVAAALAWIALIEGIVGQLLGVGLTRWLPFAAGEALDRSATTQVLPQWGAAVLLLGYTAVFVVAAMLTTLRRDVT
jgi:ABC-2 type transport system permease protein